MTRNNNSNGAPVAVVTGAGGTLCSTLARHLARRQFALALLGRTRSSLETVAESIRAEGGTALCVPVDVTDKSAVREAGREVETTLGACRVLINGAGGKLPGGVMSASHFTPAELEPGSEVLGFFNCEMDVFRREVELNLYGAALCSQVFGRSMAGAGGGSIIFFASMTSYRPLSKIAAYSAGKAALVNFTQWLASYLAPAHIRVNAIAPGFFVNERSRHLLFHYDGTPSERGADVLRQTPMGRFGEAHELIGTLDWLLDDQASGFVTGITVPVDGGFLACPGV